MRKIRTGKILAVVSAIMLLVSAFAVTAFAAAPKEGQLFPVFLLTEIQPQYSFWYTSAADGTDPLKGATKIETFESGSRVYYESDNDILLQVEKKGDKISKAVLVFTAPADGEYSMEFWTGLFSEGPDTHYAMEVYVAGKLVEGSHKENVGNSWGDKYTLDGIKAREGAAICVTLAKAHEGGEIVAEKQQLRMNGFKINFVKSVEFEPETPPAPDTSDGIVAVAITIALCGAAVVLAKKAHR